MLGVGRGPPPGSARARLQPSTSVSGSTRVPSPGPEPALEVDAPNVVGRRGGEQRPAGRPASLDPALHRQPLAVEERADRARRRPRAVRAPALDRAPPAPSPVPRSDAGAAARDRPRAADPPRPADGFAAPATGRPARQHPLPATVAATCSPSPPTQLQNAGAPPRAGSSPASTASTKRARSSMTPVSLHGIGKVLLADRITCHHLSRYNLSPM